MSVRAVELSDSETSVGKVLVGDKGCARGTAGAVEAEGDGVDGANAGEETLYGWCQGEGRAVGEGVSRTSRSSSVRS